MAGLSHIIAGFSRGLQHRLTLRQILDDTPRDSCLQTLDPQILKQSGIRALALDFDGVLAHHGAPAPDRESVQWLQHSAELFGEEMIFILSNKPTEGRRRWFAENFPSLRFISGVRKKPYPDGIIQTGELAGVPLSAILMVDDRLLTGCLAAVLAGARPCYVRRPTVSFSGRPAAELFFMLLRWFERCFVQTVTIR